MGRSGKAIASRVFGPKGAIAHGGRAAREQFRQSLADASGSIDEIVKVLGIEKWDAILIGDGSGSRWGYPVGWCSTLLTRDPEQILPFFGGCNQGTSQTAEIFAYLTPLIWLSSNMEDYTGFDMHIATDSEYVAMTGSPNAPRKKHQELWQFFDTFGRKGMRIRWHAIPRDSHAFNKFADEVAGQCRLLFRDGSFPNPPGFDDTDGQMTQKMFPEFGE